jgi:hypothetical protein
VGGLHEFAQEKSCKPPSYRPYGTIQILDFLESAPLIYTVSLLYPMEGSSDTPPERIVTLRHLKIYTIKAEQPPPILLHHLHIPTGASLTLEFYSDGEEFLLPDYLAKRSLNFSNLSNIIAINLFFDSNRTFVRFSGQSGSLRVLAHSRGTFPYTAECRIFRSLHSTLPTIKRLAVLKLGEPGSVELEDSPIFQIVSSTNHLQTLILNDSFHLPFVPWTQNKTQTTSYCALIWKNPFFALGFGTASSGFDYGTESGFERVKLLLVTLVDAAGRGTQEPEEAFELREHVTQVEHRVDFELPPGGSCREGK